jgi:AcrR family transcriptional regulator
LRARLLDDIGVAVGRGHARAKILAAAIDTFPVHGVDATRVEDILQTAGLSRRTFYQHFDDKLAVVHAIYELVIRQLAETFVVASAGATDPTVAITRLLDAYFELHRTDRAMVRVLIEESLRASSPLYELRQRFRQQIATALDAMFAATTAHAPDPLVSVALVSALEGVSLDLLAHDISDHDVARARSVVIGLITLVRDHPLPRSTVDVRAQPARSPHD